MTILNAWRRRATSIFTNYGDGHLTGAEAAVEIECTVIVSTSPGGSDPPSATPQRGRREKVQEMILAVATVMDGEELGSE
jgi:hypothetical protein